MLDSDGSVDDRMRDHQAGDGIGFYELEFMSAFLPKSERAEEMTERAYLQAVENEQMEYGLPYRLHAPDPRTMYWTPTDVSQGIKVMVKIVDYDLTSIRDRWQADGITLGYKGPVDKDGPLSIYGGEVGPPTGAEFDRLVRFVLIATEYEIYHCVYPNTHSGSGAWSEDESTPNLVLIKSYPNPVGKVPFFPSVGDVSSDPDPAYMYIPLAQESLDQSDTMSRLKTALLNKALMEAKKPWPIQARTQDWDIDALKALPLPDAIENGWLKVPFGLELATFPENPMPDLYRMINEMDEQVRGFDLTISNSGVIGKSSAAWGMSIVQDEINAVLKRAVDSRASAKEGYLKAILDCTYSKHKEGIYIRSTQRSKKAPESGDMDSYIKLKPEDIKPGSYRLTVSIDDQTPAQRATNTEYWRQLRLPDASGKPVVSRETFITEATPIKDVVAEEARIFRETVREGLDDPVNAARALNRIVMTQTFGQQLTDAILPPVPGAPQAPPPQAMPPAEGDSNTVTPRPYPVMPGLGMQGEQPEPAPHPIMNGVRPSV